MFDVDKIWFGLGMGWDGNGDGTEDVREDWDEDYVEDNMRWWASNLGDKAC